MRGGPVHARAKEAVFKPICKPICDNERFCDNLRTDRYNDTIVNLHTRPSMFPFPVLSKINKKVSPKPPKVNWKLGKKAFCVIADKIGTCTAFNRVRGKNWYNFDLATALRELKTKANVSPQPTKPKAVKKNRKAHEPTPPTHFLKSGALGVSEGLVYRHEPLINPLKLSDADPHLFFSKLIDHEKEG